MTTIGVVYTYIESFRKLEHIPLWILRNVDMAELMSYLIFGIALTLSTSI